MTQIGKNIQKSWRNISLFSLSIKDQTFLIKRLSFLIKAGIPILESLTMIQEQTRAGRFERILSSIVSDVSRGQSLASSMGKFKRLFGEFSLNIISFGEESGILSENLEYLAEEMKKKQMLRKKIISAFIYPVIVTLATFGITGFLMVYLFPKITPVFSSLHVNLPLSTIIVISLSNFLIAYGLYLISGLVALFIIIFILLKQNNFFHYYFDLFMLKLPILKKVLQDYNLANSTRTIGLLLKSGITVSEALPIVAKTTTNLVYKKEFRRLSTVIERGGKISVYLSTRRRIFPDILSQIISVGERSGNLSQSFISKFLIKNDSLIDLDNPKIRLCFSKEN